MLPPVDLIASSGEGPNVVLVHGTATDARYFHPLVRLLRQRARLTVYPRRGCPAWPSEPAPDRIADHVSDLLDVVKWLDTSPVYLFGASFGATIVLEACCARPGPVRGAMLFEPPVSAVDGAAAVPAFMHAEFERALSNGSPEQAATKFYRKLLGEFVWARLPAATRAEAATFWRQIRGDLEAGASYEIHYDRLGSIDVPIQLVRGDRPGNAFDEPLRALHVALPRSELRVLDGVGHHVTGGAWRTVADVLAEFIKA